MASSSSEVSSASSRGKPLVSRSRRRSTAVFLLRDELEREEEGKIKMKEEKRLMEEEKKRFEDEKKTVEEEKKNLAKERLRLRKESEENRRNQVSVSAFLLNPPAEFLEGPKVGASGSVVAPSQKGVPPFPAPGQVPPFPAPGQGRQSRTKKLEVKTIDLPIIGTGDQYRQPPGAQAGLPSNYGYRCPVTKPIWQVPAFQDASKEGEAWSVYGDGLPPWKSYGEDLNVRLGSLQSQISDTIAEKRKFEAVIESSVKRQKCQGNTSSDPSMIPRAHGEHRGGVEDRELPELLARPLHDVAQVPGIVRAVGMSGGCGANPFGKPEEVRSCLQAPPLSVADQAGVSGRPDQFPHRGRFRGKDNGFRGSFRGGNGNGNGFRGSFRGGREREFEANFRGGNGNVFRGSFRRGKERGCEANFRGGNGFKGSFRGGKRGFETRFRGGNKRDFEANFRGGNGRGFEKRDGRNLRGDYARGKRGSEFRGPRGANASAGGSVVDRLGPKLSEPVRKEGEREGKDESSLVTSPLETEVGKSSKAIRFQDTEDEEDPDWEQEDELVVDLAAEAPEADSTLVEEDSAAAPTLPPPSAGPRVSFRDPYKLNPSGGAVLKGFGRGKPRE